MRSILFLLLKLADPDPLHSLPSSVVAAGHESPVWFIEAKNATGHLSP